jgi:hypothetical protein
VIEGFLNFFQINKGFYINVGRLNVFEAFLILVQRSGGFCLEM